MAIFRINDMWRIKSDAYCWSLQKFSGIGKDAKPHWAGVAHYGNPVSCAEEYVRLQVRLSDLDDPSKVSAMERDLWAAVEGITALLETTTGRQPDVEHFRPYTQGAEEGGAEKG